MEAVDKKRAGEEKISIIVPVYNTGEYLKETIDSVLAQTCGNWELLLVDDYSSDNSREIISRYAACEERIRPIFNRHNQGAATSRNIGLKEAAGRYIAFLDADDLWKADKLEKEMAFMKKNRAGFVFSGYEFGDENGRGTGKIVRVPQTLTYRQALKNTTIFTTTVLFDTEKIPKEILYMPQVKSEDTATWWQILRQGHVAWGLDENLAVYRRSKGTLSSNKLEAVRRIWYLYRRVEKLSLPYSFYNFFFYAARAVSRRI